MALGRAVPLIEGQTSGTAASRLSVDRASSGLNAGCEDCPPGRGCRLAASEGLEPRAAHVSSLWTLQRLRFEPEVAANSFDREENRDPGLAIPRAMQPFDKETAIRGRLLCRKGESGLWRRGRVRACVRPFGAACQPLAQMKFAGEEPIRSARSAGACPRAACSRPRLDRCAITPSSPSQPPWPPTRRRSSTQAATAIVGA
jgi:hypothetical protein